MQPWLTTDSRGPRPMSCGDRGPVETWSNHHGQRQTLLPVCSSHTAEPRFVSTQQNEAHWAELLQPQLQISLTQ